MENYKTSRSKSGCSHLQEVFTCQEIFGVLDRRSLLGGGHTWSCDCNNVLQGTSTCTVALQVDDQYMLIMTFSCIKIFFMSFSHSNKLFRIIVSRWKGH